MSASAALAHAPVEAITLSPFQRQASLVPEECDLLLGGGRGGGKSYLLALLQSRHAEQVGPRARMLFVRQNYRGMRDFEEIQRQVFGAIYGAAAKYNASDYFWRFPNGATLQNDQFEGRADYSKFHGKSFTFISVDEAGEYGDPTLLDLLRSCLRAPAPIVPRFVLSANPGGAGHGWLSRRHVFKAAPWTPYRDNATGRTFVNAPSTYRDNTEIDQPAYRRQLEAATSTDPELGRAWIDADWTVARGAFFSAVLDQSRVMVEPWEPGRLPAGWAAPFLAHDYGVSAPSVTYVVARSPGARGPDGRFYPRNSLILLDELATNEPDNLGRGMGYTIPVLAERIRELAQPWKIRPEGVADDAIFGRTGSAAGSLAQEFAGHGVFFHGAGKGRRVPGWQVMRRMLEGAAEPDRPGLYVSRRCEYWWLTIPSLPRDPRCPDDVDSRAADHAADACRYACVYEPPRGLRTGLTVGLY